MNTTNELKLFKHHGADGCIMVIADGIGCVAVCVDHTHADYVIKALHDGRHRIGGKGVEVVKEQDKENGNKKTDSE